MSGGRALPGLLSVSLFFLFIALAAGPTFGQSVSGGVQGNITDASGAALPQANIEISGGSLVQPITLTTNNSGFFSTSAIPPGTYVVTVSAQGFSTTRQTDVHVEVSKISRVDLSLTVGAVTQTVEVSGSAALVDTTTSTVQTSISSSTYDLLPKSRSFDSLLALAPGVRKEPKGGGYSSDGASGSENTYMIDGVEVNSVYNGTLNRQSQTPVEWIGESSVKTSSADAQERSATGGVVNAVTKSGSDAFHGQALLYAKWSAFEPVQDTPYLRLNPNNDRIGEYFTSKKDGFRSLNPGYELGGPIWKSHIWFYSSYMPILENFTRNVNFNTGQNGVYKQSTRQDFWLNKLDYSPTSSLRFSGAYQYSPFKTNGLLPVQRGTDSFANPWADRGSRQPQTQVTYHGSWTASSRFILEGFGGYWYNNNKDYGVPNGTYYDYLSTSRGLAGVPLNLQAPAGDFTPRNDRTVQDIYKRNSVALIGSYIANFGGEHRLKAGWELYRLSNAPLAGAYPDGRIYVYWNRSYNAVTKPGSFRGPYGYYASRPFVTQGNVSSNNQGMFFQDDWRVAKRLTVNLGVRFDHEVIPSFSSRTDIPSTVLDFGFGQKVAPRLGAAWDITGTGKMKLYGGWGWYYDTIKYALPRGSFGGDYWVDTYYTLDNSNIFGIQPTPGNLFGTSGTFPGTKIESLDRRIPSNDPANNLVEPNLKPMKLNKFDIAYDWSVTNSWLFSARYGHQNLIRAIEDVGVLTSAGEQYYIANPGFGVTAKSSAPGIPPTPKAERRYDAVDLAISHRFSSQYYLRASYTWSRLYGNYAGLANSDEITNGTGAGRTDPNVSRAFDLPWSMYDDKGQPVYGRLGTDRPNTFKFFGSYTLKSFLGSTVFAPIFQVYSGTPNTTDFNVLGVPVNVYGRNDLGRTPVFSQTDLMVYHDIPLPKAREGMKLRLEFNAVNLFNQASVLSYWSSYVHPNYGSQISFSNQADFFKGFDPVTLAAQQGIVQDPRYGKPNAYQSPRDIRLGIHFFF